VNANLEQIWPQVQARLAAAVDDATYRVWLEPLLPRELTAGALVVEVSPRAYEWVHQRFGRLLQSCVATVLGPTVAVSLVRSDTASLDVGEQPQRHGRIAAASSLGSPRLSFEHFVIGDCNRLAHAAALAVAEQPGHVYNPLFLCGPPGVGKTHLLRSVARMVTAHTPGLTVRLTTGEAFTNEFQTALGADRMAGFKAHFRHVDVLLVDDVQFFERKARTEEEFFHTFDALHDAGAQLVLTSDRPPRDLQALEDRLRARFAAGLVAEVHPPDVNTRLAILRKRVHHDGIDSIDPLVLDTLARRVTLNIRALEGALIRVVAFSSLTGRPLTPELAAEVLDALHPATPATPRTLAEIKAAACRHFDLTPDELLSTSRGARVAWPRQVAMYLARELTEESLPAIGRHFGGRDHTTVLHAWRRTAARIGTDSTSRSAVDKLREQLERAPC
jgi:chromosomal replication initiator protein